jgi:hypothetical protein
MVGVAQLVEHLVVIQDAAGSSPVTHPKAPVGQCSFSSSSPTDGKGEASHASFNDE